MLEPQSTALFLICIVVFCALLCWLALARQTVFRILAGCLAFIPPMLFGVAAVNKYYGYYQTWGAVAADLGGQGANQGRPCRPSMPLPARNWARSWAGRSTSRRRHSRARPSALPCGASPVT